MSYYGNFQSKVIERLVKLLQTDPYLITKVAGRVYEAHPSLLDNPKFPAITVTRQGLGGDTSLPQIDYPFLIIDVWSKKNVAELWSIYADHDTITNKPRGIRSLLHVPLGFDFPEAQVDYIAEVWVTDNLYEPWSKTFHLTARYSLKMAAKNVV